MSPTYTRAVGRIAQTDAPATIRAKIRKSRLGASAERAHATAVAPRLIRIIRTRPRRSDAKLKRDGDQDRCDREPVDHGYEWTRRQKPDVEPRVSHCRPSA